MTHRPLRFVHLSLVLLLAACGGGEDADAPATDAPTTAQTGAMDEPAEAGAEPIECVVGSGTPAPVDFTPADWTGAYALVMLGPDGLRTAGSLTLQEQAEELRTVVGPGGEVATNTTIPLFGWAEIDVAAVGATIPGSLASEDPTEPGVILLLSRMGDQPPTLMLRLGSEANRRGQARFDGAFTVLRVTEVAEDGLRGRWSSGVGMDRAEGSFCALR